MTPGEAAPPSQPIDPMRPLSAAASIDEAFFEVSTLFPSHAAVMTAEGGFSYQQLVNAAADVHRSLARHRDFQPGDRVLLMLGNGPAFPAALYGVMRAGGVAIPLPPDVEPARLQHVLRSSEARIILSDARSIARRGDLGAARRMEIETTTFIDPDPRDTPADPGALAMIVFTSGSSGDPKGVMLSHRNVLANTRYIWNHLPIEANDRALCTSPCCHAFGHGVMQSHLLRGATVIFDGSLMFPASIIEAVQRHQATSLAAVPDAYRFILRRTTFEHRQAPSLRYASTAGSPMSAEEAAEIAERVKPASFFCLYGQTESTSRICVHGSEEFRDHPGSIGRGGPDIEVEVVDEAGDPTPPGATGEVRARADNIMLGYWRDPEATQRVLRDGWLYTGDLATIDEHGFIYLRGRADHLVKIGGHRVNLAEIERLARQRLPVAEATAVTFETTEGGVRLGLFVQPSTENAGLTPEAALNAMRGDLPRHKVPAVVEVLGSFPRTASMKVDRMALAHRARSLAAASSTIRP